MRHISLLFFITILISGCDKHAGEKHAHQAHAEEHEEQEKLTLTAAQIEATGMRFGKIDNRNLSGAVRASGMLELPPQNQARVSTQAGGVITKVHVIPGDEVKAGQTLALLESPQITQLQEEYRKAVQDLKYAKQEYERQKGLWDDNVIAEKKYQAAETEYQGKQNLVSSLKTQLLAVGISPGTAATGNFQRYAPLRSPIGGFVHKIHVNTGSFVEPGKDIFWIVDNHHVHIDLQIYEKDLDKVKVGQLIHFGFSENGEKPYCAEIFAVGKAYDEQTRSVSIHAEIKNNQNKNFLPGMYIHASIMTDSSSVPSLPQDAIIRQGDLHYLFVVEKPATDNSPAIFRKVPVKTGMADGGYIHVTPLEEIGKNELIVTEGAYYLKAKILQEEGGGGHHH